MYSFYKRQKNQSTGIYVLKEAATGDVSQNLVSQNSQENTCTTVSFLITLIKNVVITLLIKLISFSNNLYYSLLKKRLRQRCFPENFAKFLSKPF